MKTKLNGMLTLFLALVVQFSFAQNRTISGTISDDSGPLPGVSVLKKGTQSGTETDFDGKYSLKANSGDILVFRYLGYKTREQTVGNSNTINITLEEGGEVLEEVVVTALGRKKQARSLGYSAVKIGGKDLNEVSNQNPFESLSGKIAGVDISAPAQPGASAKIISRGFSSLTGSNRPLIVIDGSPILDIGNGASNTISNSFDAGTGLNDIDPNTIESINFLKGASASALYGSRGSNGVILITTIKGKGELKVKISSNYDFNEVARVPHYQNQFGTGWNGASFSTVTGEGKSASNENGSWGAAFDGKVRPWSRIVNGQQLIKPYVALPNNIRDFYTLGESNSQSINISSGDEKRDISFSYSRFDTDGVIPRSNDTFTKNNIGLKTGFKDKKFSFRTSINYNTKKQGAIATGQGDDAGLGKSYIQELIQFPVDISIVDLEDQSLIFNQPSYLYTPYASNPYVSIENNTTNISKNRFFGNVNFSYNFTENFSASLQISQDIDNESIKRAGDIIEYEDGSPQDNGGANGVVGAVVEYKYTNKQTDSNFNLNYNTTLNENLELSALLGGNYNERSRDVLGVVRADLELPNYFEITNSAADPILIQDNFLRRSYSIFGEVELAYQNKYFLTLTGRNDYTSTLPIKNNSYFYPSVSFASVILEEEDYFLKLRAAWASLGNDTRPYQTAETAGLANNGAYYGNIGYPFAGVNSNEIFGRIANPELRPELTNELEFGFNASLFRKVELDVSYYIKNTKDLILNIPVARSTGYSVSAGNFASLENKGIEVVLTVKPIKTTDFSWNFNYTFTKNNSNVTNVDNAEGRVLLNSAYDVNFYAEQGRPVGSFYAPVPAKSPNGEYIVDAATGYYVATDEEEYLGTSQRDFVMGLTNSFKYKNFNLGFSFDWKQGGKLYSYTKRLSHFVGNGIETTYNNRNPWIVPNSVNRIVTGQDADGKDTYRYEENTTPVAFNRVTGFYNGSNNPAIQSTHIIDKTFIRMRSIALSYNFPTELLKSLKISNLSLSVYGKNLFLWTPADNPYIDPESTNYGAGLRSEFGEFASNPSQRTYGMKLNITLK